MPTPTVSVVIPVYGNEATLDELHARIHNAVAHAYIEFIYVDDAGPDDSRLVLRRLAERDDRVHVVQMDQNVGQHAAVFVGLSYTTGQRIVVLDADLQDPPEILPQLLRGLDEGYEAVFGGRAGQYESVPLLAASWIFKRLLALTAGVPTDAGLLIAMSRRMVEHLGELPSRNPHIVAMIGHSGYAVSSLPVRRQRRSSGASGYDLPKRLRLARQALTWRIRAAWVGRTGTRSRLPAHTVLAAHRPQPRHDE
jgi:polyisoprenyl-phosphate glycosyltransferase